MLLFEKIYCGNVCIKKFPSLENTSRLANKFRKKLSIFLNLNKNGKYIFLTNFRPSIVTSLKYYINYEFTKCPIFFRPCPIYVSQNNFCCVFSLFSLSFNRISLIILRYCSCCLLFIIKRNIFV